MIGLSVAHPIRGAITEAQLAAVGDPMQTVAAGILTIVHHLALLNELCVVRHDVAPVSVRNVTLAPEVVAGHLEAVVEPDAELVTAEPLEVIVSVWLQDVVGSSDDRVAVLASVGLVQLMLLPPMVAGVTHLMALQLSRVDVVETAGVFQLSADLACNLFHIVSCFLWNNGTIISL